MSIESARSFARGEVTREEVLALANRFREGGPEDSNGPYKVRTITNLLNSITNHGTSDDPQTITLVTGDLTARDIITAGFLEVHGNLTCGRLLGDYNDCSAYISNDVTADLFYPENHSFTIGGSLHTGTTLSSSDPKLFDILDRDLVEAFDDEDQNGNPVTWIDHLHFDKIKQRIAAGLPLLTPPGESESASGEPS